MAETDSTRCCHGTILDWPVPGLVEIVQAMADAGYTCDVSCEGEEYAWDVTPDRIVEEVHAVDLSNVIFRPQGDPAGFADA